MINDFPPFDLTTFNLRVIVGSQKPVSLVMMVLVNIIDGRFHFTPQVVPAFPYRQLHCWYRCVWNKCNMIVITRDRNIVYLPKLQGKWDTSIKYSPYSVLKNTNLVHFFPQVFFIATGNLRWFAGCVITQHRTLTLAARASAIDVSSSGWTFFNFRLSFGTFDR